MTDLINDLPDNYKSLLHYIKAASEHEKRDQIVTYYCQLYTLQRGMELDKKSPECRNYLKNLMGSLEKIKMQNKDNEAIQSELVGQAHLENYAIKLFYHADTEDRAGRFGKNVVKLFYTAGILMDVLTNFGQLSEDIEKNRKYAKWKAAYIHNCLKAGETPQAGPMSDMQNYDESNKNLPSSSSANNNYTNQQDNSSLVNQFPNSNQYPMNQPLNKVLPSQPANYFSGAAFNDGSSNPNMMPNFGYPNNYPNNPNFIGTNNMDGGNLRPQQQQQPNIKNPPSGFDQFRSASPTPGYQLPKQDNVYKAYEQDASVSLNSEHYSKAMKFCKFANSALQYEDAKTAIENLNKALRLLSTGKE